MVNRSRPLARACALYLACTGCGADGAAAPSSVAGSSPTSNGGTAVASGEEGGSASSSSSAGRAAAGTGPGAGGGGAAGASNGPPPPLAGESIYALECHGESRDCRTADVPCFGVGSSTPNVAAGWACSNRCLSDADCSDAPSGAEAKASCVPFTSASHCVLVCKNDNESLSCPTGMSCYAPPKAPLGYCLWQ